MAEGIENVSKSSRRGRGTPDYFLAIAYILVYLEVGWLIFMLLRMYSRD